MELNKKKSKTLKPHWTLNELNWFVENYPKLGKIASMKYLNKSEASIRAQAYELNLKSDFKFNKQANFNRGSGWRGKARPVHSEWMKTNRKTITHQGWYEMNGKKFYFRSAWEANYAIYLDFLIKQKQIQKWEYEPETFWFEKIRRGVRSYKPDFKIYKIDGNTEFHEVKGYMDAQSKTKIKRMAKYYPQIKLIVIDKDCYRDIVKKVGKMLNFFTKQD